MRRYLSYLSLTIAFTASLAAIYLIFAPGVSGPFLLDDHVHFPKLHGNDGNIDTVEEVLNLVGSGASATGRPLSFLSLLIEDNGWPSPPHDYKQNNLLFHLINFCLVFLLSIKLLRFTDFRKKESSIYLALFVSIVWAVSPIQESAIFLTIQRMTLLATSMMLISLIIIVSVWEKERGKLSSLTLYFLSGLFCILGLLFKEVAILTVFYVYAAAYLARSSGVQVYLYALIRYSCIIVALACIAYFFADHAKMQSLYEKRDFTMAERLMTEGRVLVDYIRQILLPSMSGLGPFHDGYTISRNMFEPLSTFFSWAAILIIIGASFILRKRVPLLFFATLWFFLGHTLESTFLPLEIYFEHRNYLAAYGVLLLVVVSLFASMSTKIAFCILIVYISLISFVSYTSAKVWGSQEGLYHIWLSESPSSTRARIEVVKNELSKGRPASAEDIYKSGLVYHREHAGYYLFGYIIDRCLTPYYKFDNISKDKLYNVIDGSGFDHASLEGISWLVKSWEKWNCDLNLDDIEDIAERYLSSGKFFNVKDARLSIENNLSKIAVKQGDLNDAVSYLESNYEVSSDPTFLINAAYLLASGGLFNKSEELFSVVDDRISREKNPLNMVRYKRVRDNTLDLVERMQEENHTIRRRNED